MTTENARFLPRFQILCERFGLKPTWLTNYEMAESPVFCEFGRDVLRRGAGEIGMHLHAWDSPPLTPGPRGQAYLIEFPEDVMREKVAFMTALLEGRFGEKMTSHRAGRWAFDSRYARLLVEHGYLVDCSVTPYVSWAAHPGDPDGAGGSDYTSFPPSPTSWIWSGSTARTLVLARGPRLDRPAGRQAAVAATQGQNRDSMHAILRRAREEGWPCVLFILHSSELMPGGSPTFPTDDAIESLYEDLESVFAEGAEHFRGATLSEFYDEMLLSR